MDLYFAPLEGITGYIYRNAHRKYFPWIAKYFSPFISPNQNRSFSLREKRDILPPHNEGLYLVPQILTNKAEHFIRAATELKTDYGYSEVNLNLGCPSATVTSKGKGAGFLAQKEELNVFLYRIFEAAETEISVKTRIGDEAPEEFYELLEIFNQYPLKELIVHPRVRTDFYRNRPDRELFAAAGGISRNILCYNGDIFTEGDYDVFCAEFPNADRIMMGRGFLMDPGFFRKGVEEAACRDKLKAFHDKVYEDYKEAFAGDTNVLFKMKELWFYMGHIFTEPDKYMKKIKKAARFCDYEAAVRQLFEEQKITEAH